MKQRIITGIVGIALLSVVLFFYQTIVFDIVIALVSVGAVLEMLDVCKVRDNTPVLVTSLLFAALVPFLRGGFLSPYGSLAPYVFAGVLLVLMIIQYPKLRFDKLSIAFFSSMLIPYAFSTFLYIRDMITEFNLLYLLIILVAAMIQDIFAYFVGKFFGRHKLIPSISPNKTVEGAVGGFVFCVLGTLLTAYIYQQVIFSMGTQFQIHYLWLALIAAVLAVVGVLGDLAASVIKRQNEVKDFGNALPGHGGILDRLDSMLFVAPTMYILIQFIPLVSPM
ncbi:phosphatidate cytidylyltransferase [Candidatus Soleaferrea massiliensis]|uniref:phosphatidate cytidylyltransferase n=1 Tax=Candidatus Soleaferrea massiliensis TaxID=1470354 RepID=UPI0005910B91|nr:phosphatidate cytidylyltransferase [Candidatus Soleaferrea massiliensis]